MVRTLPEQTLVNSAQRVFVASSIHDELTRQIVPAAAVATWDAHDLDAAAWARAAAARSFNAARRFALSVPDDRIPHIDNEDRAYVM